MKSKLLVLTAVTLFSFSGHLFAYAKMEQEKGMKTVDSEKQSTMTKSADTATDMRVATEEDIKNLPNIGNKLCPVSGNPVEDGSMGEAIKYVYNGKIYNLCCSMCVKDFKKNPEKYSAVAEKEVKETK